MKHLDIRDVSKRYGATEVLTPISLGIDAGEIVTFLGPSGCGKTTLMRLVGGLERLDAGTITLAGDRLGRPDRRRGMVFQSYAAFPWLTVLGNIRFGLKYRPDLSAGEKEDIARYYLELVGLTGFADHYTNRISGGMRQRVAIARTLASAPDVLLMDEPFGALDALTRENLQLKLLDINRTEAKTTIFVTHDVEEAILLAHRVVIFSARPARIIEEIDVASRIPVDARGPDVVESPEFIEIRLHVQQIIRAEYLRATEGERAS